MTSSSTRTSSVALVGLVVAACGGSPGRIANPRRGPSAFVTERQPLLVTTAEGLVRIALDGSSKERVASARYRHLASTADGRTLAVGDEDTNLFLIVPGDSSPRRVSQLDGRAGAVALSSDGKRLAVARHADFSQPQGQWSKTEDDAIYVVDTETMALDVFPATRDELVTGLRWSPDDNSLVLTMMGSTSVRLDLATRARTPSEAGGSSELAVTAGGTRCAATGDMIELAGHRGDDGIDVISASGTTRVVKVEGRKRGFHDYQATIGDAVFSASCRYIVFQWDRGVYVADRESGTVGHLLDGWFVKMLALPER